MKNVGLIGLGNAGGPFGQRLLAQGHHVKVFDLNSEAMDTRVKLGADYQVGATCQYHRNL